MSLEAQPGLVAVGDSITHGTGTTALGVHCQSWALWLARALDLPFTNLAQDGATVPDVVAQQLPRVRHAYAVGTIYVGVNDVRAPGFDAEAYAAGLDRIAAHLAAHARRLVMCTMPMDLGRPRAGAKVQAANDLIRVTARRHDAAVAGLEDLAGPPLVLPDAVHPTAVGQLEIADRVAVALGADVRPSSPVLVHRSRRALAHYFLFTHAPAVARDLRRRGVEDWQRRGAA